MPMVNGKPTSRKAWVGIEIDEQPMPRHDFDKAVLFGPSCTFIEMDRCLPRE
ncbi:hypothetical protein DPMN_044342 [Dreissena polymorpha]|uniref:Uncharacterized protein n=1 Tax=Dreissena polymorpha TaxID=45954 RepID=A0A9D4D5N4_DREPO|nr:hypothetical protein DPMN_044342 [Dreissena polymorpha]